MNRFKIIPVIYIELSSNYMHIFYTNTNNFIQFLQQTFLWITYTCTIIE